MRTIDKIAEEVNSEDEFDRMTPEVIAAMSDKFKNEFAKDLLNGSGREMVKTISIQNQKIRFKKPVKVRFSDFKEKMKNKFIAVFGL